HFALAIRPFFLFHKQLVRNSATSTNIRSHHGPQEIPRRLGRRFCRNAPLQGQSERSSFSFRTGRQLPTRLPSFRSGRSTRALPVSQELHVGLGDGRLSGRGRMESRRQRRVRLGPLRAHRRQDQGRGHRRRRLRLLLPLQGRYSTCEIVKLNQL